MDLNGTKSTIPQYHMLLQLSSESCATLLYVRSSIIFSFGEIYLFVLPYFIIACRLVLSTRS